MAHPYLTIDVAKLERNTRVIVELCARYGVAVTGVTKATCGHPDVARAMLRGGVIGIGESRLENILRLQAAGVDASWLLLRVPPLSEVDEVVAAVDISLNSEFDVLAGLSAAATRRARVHRVILMVDLGDLREGIWPDDLVPFVRRALRLPGVEISGLGTNLSCFGGVVPSEDNMGRLVACAREIEQTFGLSLQWISGLNSSGLELLASGRMPPRVNHARIGEAILLGRETVHRRPWPGTVQDAFVLHAEVIECKQKPSVPVGARSEDAFGHLPVFEDHGEVRRALVNVGREDVDIEGMMPRDQRLSVLGGSSDYVIVDVSGADDISVGDELEFTLNYGALLATMTSGYIEKRTLGADDNTKKSC